MIFLCGALWYAPWQTSVRHGTSCHQNQRRAKKNFQKVPSSHWIKILINVNLWKILAEEMEKNYNSINFVQKHMIIKYIIRKSFDYCFRSLKTFFQMFHKSKTFHYNYNKKSLALAILNRGFHFYVTKKYQ